MFVSLRSFLYAAVLLGLTTACEGTILPIGGGEGGGGTAGGWATAGGDEVPLPPPERAADPALSVVEVTPPGGVPADGLSAYAVRVTLRASDGQPVSGARVTLAAAAPELRFPRPVASDGDGRAAYSVSSTRPGTFEISVSVDLPDGSALELSRQSLTFVEGCRSDAQALEEYGWGPVFSRCVGCHNDFGLARAQMLTFQMVHPGAPDWARRNVEVLATQANIDVQTAAGMMPKLLAKPSGQAGGHAGGVIIAPGTEEYRILEGMVALLREADTCTGTVDAAAQLLQGASLLGPRESYVRAVQVLTGRPVRAAELMAMSDTETALEQRLDALLASPEVLSRVEEYFDDWLLTRQNLERVIVGASVNLGPGYPRQGWFGPACGAGNPVGCCDTVNDTCCIELHPAATCQAWAVQALDSVALEPVALVKHVVKNDLPLSELVTAGYGMFNPLSARLRGMTDAQLSMLFDADPSNDFTEFVPAVLSDTPFNTIAPSPDGTSNYPHAGLLNMPVVLNRWEAGSKQRSRSFALVIDRMLALPLMQFAEFNTAQVPLGADLQQATQQYQACSVCHAALDPVAGFFNDWGMRTATYTPNAGRPQYMPATALGSAALPAAPGKEPLQWVGPHIAAHPRFAYAMVLPFFKGLTGAEELTPPRDVLAPDYAARALAFRVQNRYLQSLARDLRDTWALKPKPLLKAMLLGPYFRGRSVMGTATEHSALELAGVGRGAVATPEQLSRRLNAVTGWRWTPRGSRHDQLASPADCCSGRISYRELAGGLNYATTTERYREPTPLVARLQERASNAMACRGVMQDLSLTDPAARVLLPPDVTLQTTPATPAGEAVIRAGVRHLHLAVLGEDLAPGDAELEQSYGLWRSAYDTGRQLMASGGSTASLPVECRASSDPYDNALTYPRAGRSPVTTDPEYTARAWVALVSYLLSDARFLEE